MKIVPSIRITAGLMCGALLGLPGPIFAQYSHKAGSSRATYAAERSVKYEIVDGHFHFLSFVQGTAGMDAFFKAMDDTGVVESAVLGMPVVKNWEEWQDKQPTYYLDDDARVYWYSATDYLVARAVQPLPEAKRKRLHPFICGINCADRNAVDHVERMIENFPNFWEGIGEVFCRHDDLTALTYGEPSRADTKAFDRLMEAAAKHRPPDPGAQQHRVGLVGDAKLPQRD